MSTEAVRIPRRLVAAIDRAMDSPRCDAVAAAIVALAAATYAALALWLTRGVSFAADELAWFGHADGYSPGSILEPHNDHLIALTRLIFASSLDLFGAEHLPIRLAMIAAVIAVAVALFVLLRTRIGSLAALPPTLVVLFMGSTPEPLQPFVMPFAQATAAGLLALIALERRSSRGDLAACALLVIAVLSFEVGVAFAAGVAVLIAIGPDQRRRLWVAAVPLALFAAWWLWSRKFDQSATTGSLLLAPSYAADSLAAAVGALSGLSFDFSGTLNPANLDIGWGRPLAVLVVAVLALRARMVGVSALQVGLAVVLGVLWAGGALNASELRAPEAARYAYAVAVVLALLVADAFRGTRPARGALLALVAAASVALPANLYLMREHGAEVRAGSARVRADLTAIELERRVIDPQFQRSLALPVAAGAYLDAAERFGSIAFTTSQLQAQPEAVRTEADIVLGQILVPRIGPAPPRLPAGCLRTAGGAENLGIELPTGGAVLRSASPAEVTLRRFGERYSVAAGTLAPGRSATLVVPADAAGVSWQATVATPDPVTVCPPPPYS